MFAFDPGCVKTHTSARCRKYNSKTHGFHSGLQYDLACLLASHRKLFYALSGRWSFHTTKTQNGRRNGEYTSSTALVLKLTRSKQSFRGNECWSRSVCRAGPSQRSRASRPRVRLSRSADRRDDERSACERGNRACRDRQRRRRCGSSGTVVFPDLPQLESA